MKDIKEPATEIEIADLLTHEYMEPEGQNILRRLIYQRDLLLTAQKEPVAKSPAAMAGSRATAEAINKKISRILLDAIGGHNKEYRTEDGFIKWGKVEKEMHEAVNQELP